MYPSPALLRYIVCPSAGNFSSLAGTADEKFNQLFIF